MYRAMVIIYLISITIDVDLPYTYRAAQIPIHYLLMLCVFQGRQILGLYDLHDL